MVHAIPDILARIVEHKRAALIISEADRAALERKAADRAAHPERARDFRGSLVSRTPAILAEIKQASPSKGKLAEHFDPSSIARAYAEGGAAALSVLTDEKFFQGSLADLESARASVSVPVLRKDFTIDELHIVEAAAHGADAILLIAAVLSGQELRRFREMAGHFWMHALVEVHDAAELDAALDSGAEIIGVNNRNLHTFEVNLETSLRLAEKIPGDVVKVSESGIRDRADVGRLQSAGFQVFLVGEHLMRSGDPAAAIRALRS